MIVKDCSDEVMVVLSFDRDWINMKEEVGSLSRVDILDIDCVIIK